MTPQVFFLVGTLLVASGAVVERRRWSRVLLVLGMLLMLLALAPGFGLMLFT